MERPRSDETSGSRLLDYRGRSTQEVTRVLLSGQCANHSVIPQVSLGLLTLECSLPPPPPDDLHEWRVGSALLEGSILPTSVGEDRWQHATIDGAGRWTQNVEAGSGKML